jgi:hypothetical protein
MKGERFMEENREGGIVEPNKLRKGFIVLPRYLKSSRAWRLSNPIQRYVMMMLIWDANWEDSEYHCKADGNTYKVRRGELFFSSQAYAKEIGVSRQVMRTALKNLKLMGFLTRATNGSTNETTDEPTDESTRRFTAVKLCKYNTYQKLESYINLSNNPSPNLRNNQQNNQLLLKSFKEFKEFKEKEKKGNSLSNITVVVQNNMHNSPAPKLTIEDFQEQWNQMHPVKVRHISQNRRDKFRSRCKETAFTEHWRDIIKSAAESDFLSGRKPSPTHPKFKGDIDWVLSNSNNYVKILEGKYKNEELDPLKQYEIRR